MKIRNLNYYKVHNFLFIAFIFSFLFFENIWLREEIWHYISIYIMLHNIHYNY
jgi:hypothetical protein